MLPFFFKISREIIYITYGASLIPYFFTSSFEKVIKSNFAQNLILNLPEKQLVNLVEVFQKTYPVDCLKLLQCLIDWKERPIWILRVLGYWRSPQHPLRHLLLIRLLQCSAKEFFQPV
ncbi:hypothetical protein WA1_42105 [Scytonema hofmannii PCC 7110]|uniref:Transposon Tn7 transposition protein TnsD C-terminal domain-containing protein n=1 Tax=Scytonema hofmannii PCC 7110 TaxID=128403 RepID=A0A139WV49_9CYAN|nr:hypothetical protein WA1_42105 [Scytonema hofmannii PCC 7110]